MNNINNFLQDLNFKTRKVEQVSNFNMVEKEELIKTLEKEIFNLKNEVDLNLNSIGEIFTKYLADYVNFFEKNVWEFKNLYNKFLEKNEKFNLENNCNKKIDCLKNIKEKLSFANLKFNECFLECVEEVKKIDAIAEYYKDIFSFNRIIKNECSYEVEKIKNLVGVYFFKVNCFYEDWKDIT